MSDRLEQFINDNRDAFDSEEPIRKVWEQKPVSGQGTVNSEKTLVIKLSLIRKLAIAAALIIAAGAAWWVIGNRTNPDNGLAHNQPREVIKENQIPRKTEAPVQRTDSHQLAGTRPDSSADLNQKTSPATEEAESYREEMNHYASIVEIKRNELKRLEKDEPLLYKQFAGDVHKLDTVYQSLARKLPENSNHERLLEAMMQNLQLQMELLNHQLEIIKQINHSKKSAYEKAYKSA